MIPENDLYSEFVAVNAFNSSAYRCDYLQSANESSNSDDGFINYMQLFYCDFGNDKLKSISFSVFWLLVLFTGLGVTADDFLCPSLLLISKTLRLSQNIAGVTFLAFGNGAPDIFSSLAGIKQSRPELVIGELFGAGIFVTTVVAGTIFLNQEFEVMKRPLMRDLIFYMFSAYMTWFIFFKGKINIYHSIAFIALYIVYITVVIVGRIVYNKYRSDKKTADNSKSFSRRNTSERLPIDKMINQKINPTAPQHISPPNNGKLNVPQLSTGAYLKNSSLASNSEEMYFPESLGSYSQRYSGRHLVHHHLDNTIYSITREDDAASCTASNRSRSESAVSYIYNNRSRVSSVNSMATLVSIESRLDSMSEWRDFIVHICPIDLMEWSEDTIFSKICQLWKAPIYFMLTISIPVVDFESHKHNWCRILNAIHCVTGPIIFLLLTGTIQSFVGPIPVAAIVVPIGAVFAVVVYLTSVYDTAPRYHWAFGYLGFIVSVVWIYALANEVVSLLRAIGIMFDLSDVILGLTVLAWGNSLGDLISNLSMARQGFPRMGISACFGGPLLIRLMIFLNRCLYLLLGIGLPYTIMLTEETGIIKLKYTRMVTLLAATILLTLSSTLILMLFTGFKSKRFHGILLISIYIIYVTFAILIELHIL